MHELKGHTRVLIKTRNSAFIREQDVSRRTTPISRPTARSISRRSA